MINTDILDIDMGNSRMKWRFTHGLNISYGANDYSQSMPDALMNVRGKPGRVRLSAVVDQARQLELVAACRDAWAVETEIAVVQNECAGVKQGYENRERLGVDRWLGLLAMCHQIGGGVLVSCGSAITVDVLDPSGVHYGGYIVPGLRLQRESLFTQTHAVKVAADWCFDDLAPGRDTQVAVNKGLVVMVKCLIEHAVNFATTKSGNRPKILITGGDGETVRAFLDTETLYNPYLVFDGLALALP